jgi:hypothetical protein
MAEVTPLAAKAFHPVFVHIYDVSREDAIQRLNRILAHRLSPVKLGGVFHAGVEVDGCEWSYGFMEDSEDSGVEGVLPRMHPCHHFRQTVDMPWTPLRRDQIQAVISELCDEWRGCDYDLLRRNCCNFADEFCQRLGVGRIPRWVCRLARIGARIDSVMRLAQGARDPVARKPSWTAAAGARGGGAVGW